MICKKLKLKTAKLIEDFNLLFGYINTRNKFLKLRKNNNNNVKFNKY